MKILVFTASNTAEQTVFIGRVLADLRARGAQAAERNLPAFRLEKEPADKLVFALSENEAATYKDRMAEVLLVFSNGDNDAAKDLFVGLKLPNDPKELAEFDIEGFDKEVLGDESLAGFITLEKAKAEAVERGLEVTADTTREELEHMLGVDIHPGLQAGDRVTDAKNNAESGEVRIGLRTSNVLPTANGLDLVRQNDEQLKATAAQLGITVGANMKRETVINKITAKMAEVAGVDPSKTIQAPEGGVNTLEPLDGKTVAQLNDIAHAENVDLTGVSGKDNIREAIEKARKLASTGREGDANGGEDEEK